MDPYSNGVFRLTAVVLVMILLAPTACARSEPSPDPLTWTPITLGALPRALAVDGDAVSVAGERRDRGQYVPAAWVLRGRAARSVPLRPTTAYGSNADLVATTLTGDSASFVGSRAGGAHGIPRWTIWSGSPVSGVDDQPQTFETFGGPDSLGLVALGTVGGRPLLLGNWADDRPGPAFWRVSGARWARVPHGLGSTATEQRLASGLGVLGDRPVVLGHTVPSDDATTLRPTVWVGTADLRSWRPVRLGTAKVAHALDLSCSADSCLVAVRGADLTVWEVRVDGTVTELPRLRGARGVDRAQVAAAPDGGRTVAYGSAGSTALGRWDAARKQWRYATPPDGEVRDLVAAGGRLVAVVGDGDTESSPRQLVTT